MSDGLFLEIARRISRDYDDIVLEEAIVDATAMRLVLDPTQFDVLVMENRFGDILSDLSSGLVGGLGMTPSANIGENYSMFEAVHGSAPDIAGKNIANPSALILSAALMLRHLGATEHAERIENTVARVIKAGDCVTVDLGGTATTREYTDRLIAEL